jgi:hypothetical protein
MLDVSWDETAKYATATPETIRRTAEMINKYPDRFIFGSDCVAPSSIKNQMGVYEAWKPVLDLLTPEARALVLKGNYERIFDKARLDVRAWEAANKNQPKKEIPFTPISGAGHMGETNEHAH